MGFRSNLLAYPAGATPGFDPNHPAAGGIVRYSGVASGGSFINLLTGASATPTNSPNSDMVGSLGPCTGFNTASSGQSCNVSATNVNDTSATLAIIWFGTVAAVSQYLFTNATTTGTTGIALNIGSTGALRYLFVGGVAVTSSQILLSNVPYLLIGSNNGSTSTNIVVARLDNGQVFSQAIASAGTPTAPTGGYTIGNAGISGASPARGDIAAVMYSNKYNSLKTLLQLASDPWSFWYPNTNDFLSAA